MGVCRDESAVVHISGVPILLKNAPRRCTSEGRKSELMDAKRRVFSSLHSSDPRSIDLILSKRTNHGPRDFPGSRVIAWIKCCTSLRSCCFHCLIVLWLAGVLATSRPFHSLDMSRQAASCSVFVLPGCAASQRGVMITSISPDELRMRSPVDTSLFGIGGT